MLRKISGEQTKKILEEEEKGKLFNLLHFCDPSNRTLWFASTVSGSRERKRRKKWREKGLAKERKSNSKLQREERGMPPPLLPLPPLAAASLPGDALVLLLDSASALSRAEALLLPSAEEGGDEAILAVGIDAEWGPTEDSEDEGEEEAEDGGGRRRRRRGKGGADAATFVQIALRLRRPLRPPPPPSKTTTTTTTTLVLLFDLVALDHEAAAPLLKRLLAGTIATSSGSSDSSDGLQPPPPPPLRLGWGLRGDLAAVVAAGEKRRVPALAAAGRVARPAVDLRGAVLSLLRRGRSGRGSKLEELEQQLPRPTSASGSPRPSPASWGWSSTRPTSGAPGASGP